MPPSGIKYNNVVKKLGKCLIIIRPSGSKREDTRNAICLT